MFHIYLFEVLNPLNVSEKDWITQSSCPYTSFSLQHHEGKEAIFKINLEGDIHISNISWICVAFFEKEQAIPLWMGPIEKDTVQKQSQITSITNKSYSLNTLKEVMNIFKNEKILMFFSEAQIKSLLIPIAVLFSWNRITKKLNPFELFQKMILNGEEWPEAISHISSLSDPITRLKFMCSAQWIRRFFKHVIWSPDFFSENDLKKTHSERYSNDVELMNVTWDHQESDTQIQNNFIQSAQFNFQIFHQEKIKDTFIWCVDFSQNPPKDIYLEDSKTIFTVHLDIQSSIIQKNTSASLWWKDQFYSEGDCVLWKDDLFIKTPSVSHQYEKTQHIEDMPHDRFFWRFYGIAASETEFYKKKDFVIYNGKFYEALTDNIQITSVEGLLFSDQHWSDNGPIYPWHEHTHYILKENPQDSLFVYYPSLPSSKKSSVSTGIYQLMKTHESGKYFPSWVTIQELVSFNQESFWTTHEKISNWGQFLLDFLKNYTLYFMFARFRKEKISFSMPLLSQHTACVLDLYPGQILELKNWMYPNQKSFFLIITHIEWSDTSEKGAFIFIEGSPLDFYQKEFNHFFKSPTDFESLKVDIKHSSEDIHNISISLNQFFNQKTFHIHTPSWKKEVTTLLSPTPFFNFIEE
jgi:hypothetical protein